MGKLLRAAIKQASAPEMGDALHTTISSATGDGGRARHRTNDGPGGQVNSAFSEHDRHVRRDPHNDAHVMPVAAFQSKTAGVLDRLRNVKNRVGGFVEAASGVIPRDYRDDLLPYRQTQIDRAKRELDDTLRNYGPGTERPNPKGVAQYRGWLDDEYDIYADWQRSMDEAAASTQTARRQLGTGAAVAAGTAGLSAGAYYGLRDTPEEKTAAAYKLHGRRKFRGLDISIENRKGSYRHWYDQAADKKGKTLQRYPYGYVRRSKGMDGDHVDCYIGDNEKAKCVYVITTSKPPTFEAADEQKCMLGFDSATEAKRVFLQHYDSPKFFRHMVAMPYAKFEKKVLNTLHGRIKKIASNTSAEELENLVLRGPGSVEGQVPGDQLGLPTGSLVGMRHIGGNPMSPSDRIDRQFRFMDEPTDTRVLEGDTAALPESPGV